ncbi:hypothetical protein [Homoserinimonas hongtaonis]|uniref:Uncharacterized protein n=1 Tax=Homoserinimonas hongtaonis TaxID=2079791 RepID=A0A2U1T2A8_9MICO|nr:hypothetical protein [Salinibacterium hongtaonis]PWB97988.1 hypothetical protein DF220_09220 [Salinibacterium hongtaonis]
MSDPTSDAYHQIDDPELAPEAVPTDAPSNPYPHADNDEDDTDGGGEGDALEDDDEPSIGVDPDIDNS